MAGMWILLKDPGNRSALQRAFAAAPPSSKIAQTLAEKVNDTIDVADVNEQVRQQEEVELGRSSHHGSAAV
jgi:hypothetical protein